MKYHNLKRMLSIFLAAATVVLGVPFSVTAAGESEIPAQAAPPSYLDGFAESFENGLAGWHVERYEDTYIDDFQIVADPQDAGNQVLSFSRRGCWLVPDGSIWPADGKMTSLSFRMKLKERMPHNVFSDALMISYTDPGNSMGLMAFNQWNDSKGLFCRIKTIEDGVSFYTPGSPDFTDFSPDEWFDVLISYGKNVTVTFNDRYGNTCKFSTLNYFTYAGYAFGFCSTGGNDVFSYPAYYDDLKVTFSKSDREPDDEIADAEVYYAGNTFYEPGDTLDITGEKLGNTVESVAIKRLQDNAADASALSWTEEQSFDRAVDGNLEWENIPAVSGSERELDVQQRSLMGLKVAIPNDYQRGVYAVLLRARAGKDAVVLVNNPETRLRLHNDGDAASQENGWLKLLGNNLSVQNDGAKVSAVIMDQKGNKTVLDNDAVQVDTTENNSGRANEYYMTVKLPAGLAPGDYKITVHNGYGGNIAWSEPFPFAVKKTPENLQWRAKGTFNVMDYGAVGDSLSNDTAAIISALEAAEKNGGGMVYLPKGFYRILDTLYIPPNVSLVGDGPGMSVLFYDDDYWVSVPESMIYYQYNLEVSDINIYASRFRGIVTQKESEQGGSFYLRNVFVTADPNMAADGKGCLMEGYNILSAQLAILAESGEEGKGAYFYHPSASASLKNQYLEMSHMQFNFGADSLLSQNGVFFDFHAKNIYLNEVNWSRWSNISASECAVAENSKWDRGCLNYNGNLAVINCNAGNVSSNNREVFSTDGCSNYQNIAVQGLGKLDNASQSAMEEFLQDELSALGSDEQKALLISQVRQYVQQAPGSSFRLVGTNISMSELTAYVYVTEGQGAGQARKVTDYTRIGKYTYFTVQSPFKINPNRNSRCSFYYDRTKVFFLNNDIYDCATTGTYGTLVDFRFDGNTFNYAQSGVTLCANRGQIWYGTCQNSVADNIVTGHAVSVISYAAGFLGNGGTMTALTNFAVVYRRNQYGTGGSFTLCNVPRLGRSDIIVENERFQTQNARLSFGGGDVSNDGVYFRNNTNDGAGGEVSFYDDCVNILRSAGKNRQGDYRIVCDVFPVGSSIQIYGDINSDGKVTLKDSTLLRYYLAEMITLNKTQLKYADFTKDGVVDSRDVFAIRCHILGIPYEDGGVDPPEEETPVVPSIYDDVILEFGAIVDED